MCISIPVSKYKKAVESIEHWTIMKQLHLSILIQNIYNQIEAAMAIEVELYIRRLNVKKLFALAPLGISKKLNVFSERLT